MRTAVRQLILSVPLLDLVLLLIYSCSSHHFRPSPHSHLGSLPLTGNFFLSHRHHARDLELGNPWVYKSTSKVEGKYFNQNLKIKNHKNLDYFPVSLTSSVIWNLTRTQELDFLIYKVEDRESMQPKLENSLHNYGK